MPSGCLDFTAGLPRKRMAAGLLVTDPHQRVLLAEPAYKASWEIPGGCAAGIVVPSDELKSWAWCDRSEMVRPLAPLLARRITEALHARSGGSTRYIEDGVRVT